MAELRRFFSAVKVFLAGELDASELTRDLGASPSGHEDLAFYQELMRRNRQKAMRELFPSLPMLVDRGRVGRWARLVDDYVRAHPASGRHPDAFGNHFVSYLRARDAVPELWVECADYHACQLAAATLPRPSQAELGMDRTLYVRRYTHDIRAVIRTVHRCVVPLHFSPLETENRPVLSIYRSHRDETVRTLTLEFAELELLLELVRLSEDDADDAVMFHAEGELHTGAKRTKQQAAWSRLLREGVIPSAMARSQSEPSQPTCSRNECSRETHGYGINPVQRGSEIERG